MVLVLLGRAQGSIYSPGKWVHKACSLLHSQQGPSQGGSSLVPLVQGRGHAPPEHCTGSWHPRICAPGLSLAAALVADQGARKLLPHIDSLAQQMSLAALVYQYPSPSPHGRGLGLRSSLHRLPEVSVVLSRLLEGADGPA